MIGYLLLLLVSLLTCAGQLCQKRAAERWQVLAAHEGRLASTTRWLSVAVLFLGLGMLAWLGVLRRLPVSQAYPMLSVNFVLVTLAARFLFRESVTSRHWAGVAAISAGILLMGLGQ